MNLMQKLLKIKSRGFLPLLVLLTLTSCEIGTCPEELGEEKLRINAYRVDCAGEGPRKCLLVQQNDQIGSSEWTLLYQPIIGFTHEEGFVYDLRVRVEKVKDPPADASSLRYILVKEQSRTAASSN